MQDTPRNPSPFLEANFDVLPCRRCGGSGRHSYNQRHQDRCYGCMGAGLQPTAVGDRDLNEYRALHDSLYETVAARLQPGWIIDSTGCVGGVPPEWREVAEVIEEHEEWPSLADPSRTTTFTFQRVRFTDGTETRFSGNTLRRRPTEAEKAQMAALLERARANKAKAEERRQKRMASSGNGGSTS